MFNMFSSSSLNCEKKKMFPKNSILWIGSRQCLDKLFKMSSRQKNKTKKVFKSFPDFKLWNTYKLKPFSKVEIDLLEISKMFWNPENSANKHFQRCHHFAFFFSAQRRFEKRVVFAVFETTKNDDNDMTTTTRYHPQNLVYQSLHQVIASKFNFLFRISTTLT